MNKTSNKYCIFLIYLALALTTLAVVEYRRTLQIDPNHSDARQNLQILLKTLSNENKK